MYNNEAAVRDAWEIGVRPMCFECAVNVRSHVVSEVLCHGDRARKHVRRLR